MISELQAVNRMLAAIGESPVTSTTAQLPEVIQAVDTLNMVSLEVQARDWSFNSDYEYELSPDATGQIVVPGNAIRIDASDPGTDLVVRDGCLYDRINKTQFFTSPVKVDIVWKLPFTALPYPAQNYIMVRASRQFQRDWLGSSSTDKLTERTEQEAFTALIDYDGANADYNLLTNNEEILFASRRGA